MKLNQLLAGACLLIGFSACGGDSDDPVNNSTSTPDNTETPSTPDTPSVPDSPEEPDLSDYVAPTYVDWYRSISGWSDRAKWNLSNVHDPTVMLADDGYYYMYQTDASFGNATDGHGHFHARRSKNLVDWEYMGSTMTNAPAWVKDSLNTSRTRLGLPEIANPSYGYWAPVARKVKTGLYRMYYAIVVNNYIKTGLESTDANFDKSWTERAFIGVMETSDPATNKWTDKGFVVSSMSDKGTNWTRTSTSDYSGYFCYNAIDPTYVITPSGEHWLIFGSWHSGIAAMQVDAETGKPVKTLPEFCTTKTELNKVMTRIYTRDNGRWQGSEGPEIVYRNGYYYLFLAYDALAVPYNTRVVRSTNITGPYLGIDGLDVTTNGGDAYPIMTHPYKFNGDYGWVGISHCAVFDDGNDNWYYCSQGRLPENAYGDAWANAIMLGHVRRIVWTDDNWPIVLPERYGNVPQVAIDESEIAGTWEHIDLSYSYGQMKTSTSMVFDADTHKITSGTWKGATWSFDATQNILTLSNGLTLHVRRETDWESSTRRATLVYGALNAGSKKTYWGKKN